MPLAESTDDGDGSPARQQNTPPGPAPTVGSRDGGVSRRVARRCRAAAATAVCVAGAVLLLVAVRTWDVLGAIGVLLEAVAVFAAAVLARRATLWTAIGSARPADDTGQVATTGPPQPLSPAKAGAPLRRRLGAWVVPVSTVDGPQPGGGALVVHARADGVALAARDRVHIWRTDRAGTQALTATVTPESRAAGAASGRSTVTGRFVLRREPDGEIFLGSTRLTDFW